MLTRSRVHSPRRVLTELARLRQRAATLALEMARIRAKADLAAQHRAVTPDAQRWCLDVADTLERAWDGRDLVATVQGLIDVGEAVLPGYVHPAETRKVRKRE